MCLLAGFPDSLTTWGFMITQNLSLHIFFHTKILVATVAKNVMNMSLIGFKSRLTITHFKNLIIFHIFFVMVFECLDLVKNAHVTFKPKFLIL